MQFSLYDPAAPRVVATAEGNMPEGELLLSSRFEFGHKPDGVIAWIKCHVEYRAKSDGRLVRNDCHVFNNEGAAMGADQATL